MNISKTFSKFCLKNALVLSTIFALFMSFNAAADTGSFFNMKDHQSWISGLFRLNNQTNARIGTRSISNTTSIFIDTDGNTYTVTLIEDKPQQNLGKIELSSPLEMRCAVQIDNKEPFNIGCKLSDDNTTWYVQLLSGLGERFITESKLGSVLKIKISFDEPFTLTFRLRGFTSAFNRAITLMTPNEEKYF